MKSVLRSSLILAALGAALAAWSYPTLYGDTGMVLMPTADTQDHATFSFAFDYTKLKTDAGSSTAYPLRVCFGLTDNVELFLTYAEAEDNTVAYNVLGAGAKVALIEEGVYGATPGVGVGARAYKLSSNAMGDINGVDIYGVVSKTLLARGDRIEEGFNIRGHVGLAYSSFTDTVDASFIKPFGGITYMNANRSSLAFEYAPELNDNGTILRESTFSAVLRGPLSPNFILQLGTTRAFGLGSNTIFAGILYRYDERRQWDNPRPVDY